MFGSNFSFNNSSLYRNVSNRLFIIELQTNCSNDKKKQSNLFGSFHSGHPYKSADLYIALWQVEYMFQRSWFPRLWTWHYRMCYGSFTNQHKLRYFKTLNKRLHQALSVSSAVSKKFFTKVLVEDVGLYKLVIKKCVILRIMALGIYDHWATDSPEILSPDVVQDTWLIAGLCSSMDRLFIKSFSRPVLWCLGRDIIHLTTYVNPFSWVTKSFSWLITNW